MASDPTTIFQLLRNTMLKISDAPSAWADFLKFAGKLYKYSFLDQVLIYAQRPDATACAGYEVWNNTMHRYIRRGRKGIALIETGDKPGIKYVFDISDTGGRSNSRRPFLWECRQEHEESVLVSLEREYGTIEHCGLENLLEKISNQVANEYWLDHQYDILHSVDGSLLEEYDALNIGVQFRTVASASIAHVILSRCGLKSSEHFEGLDLLSIMEFNTTATVTALGTVVSKASLRVLRQIEAVIKNYEREHLAERGVTYGEQPDLHAERGLLDPRPDNQGATGEPRKVRTNEDDLSSEEQAGSLQQPSNGGETVPASSGDPENSGRALGTDDAGADEVGGSDRELESLRHHEMGGPYEQPEGPGRGDYFEGTHIQLSLFPSEEKQKQLIEEAESNVLPAFSISQADIDTILISDWGVEGRKQKITEQFSSGNTDAELADYLLSLYNVFDLNHPRTGGKHTLADGASGYVYYVAAGMRIENRDNGGRREVSYRELVGHIRELIVGQCYLPDVENPIPMGSNSQTAQQSPPEPIALEGVPSYQVGDHAVLDYGGRELSGTIGYVGEIDVRIDTRPYSWSNQRVNRELFDNALRQDERNTALFALEQPPAKNFQITDDHLGEGGAKAKYSYNTAAIKALRGIEAEGRSATLEEQHILSRYVGWGGIADAFDGSKSSWENEYNELQKLLSPEEYSAARASTLNAHYTSPIVIRAIYKAVQSMGFRTGNILEPACGVGNFFGCLPEEMATSRLYGVELDSITGRIAKQLYPKASITVAGFESTDRRDFFDLAVGNIPFGQYRVNDRAYNKLGFSIHDYFFAKTLDQVRPGGVISFVTSRYTMDKQSPEVRRYIAQRAELLGAIRLPNNAFKANAGTEVVSDIIFLQRRERPIVTEPDWVHLGQTADGFGINSYFIDHPEMVLGRPASESTQYGKQDYTVIPTPGADLATQLQEAVSHIYGQYAEALLPDLGDGKTIDTSIPADPNVANYSYTVVDGEVYYRENSRMVHPDLSETAKGRVSGMVELRDCVHQLIDLQMDEHAPDTAVQASQAELNRLYDTFSAQYGLLNSRGNKLAFSDDSSYYLLCSLELLDEEGNLVRKADMFTKRTMRQQCSVTSVDTAAEALAVSIGERAKVYLPFMAQLSGLKEEQIISDLTGVIFKDPSYGSAPEEGWQTADEYLSGNVRQKLRVAQCAAECDPAFQINVDALIKAQPKDLDASEIEVHLGATWIDKAYIQQFMEETFNTPFYLRGTIEVKYTAYTAEWQITNKTRIPYHDVAAYTTYGTDRASAYRILEDSLNLRDIRLYDTIEDGDGKERRVLNYKQTTLAEQKQQAIREAFRDWIWSDPARRHTLVKQYNEEMNSTRPREYDGGHIIFSGMNPEITLREHQLNAIAHILYGGNTLLAHEVGAGKTYEMVAACMESKRLGLAQKSIFVVPNHLTEQWASEFLRLYPAANLLVTTKKDFETHNRKKFCARIATGDYDAVIIGHSQFERIPISPERQERLLREQIWEITEGISGMS